MMLKLKLQYFLATSCEELTHWKRLWCWMGLGARGEGDNRGRDGWMASQTRWMWVWVDSGNWWWTGRPGVHGVAKSRTRLSDWTELNWTALNSFVKILLRIFASRLISDILLWFSFFVSFKEGVFYDQCILLASLSFTISQNLLKLISITSVMPSSHPILCCPVLLLPSIFPSIRSFVIRQVFPSGGQTIGASASISSSNDSGLTYFMIHWCYLLVVQGTPKSPLPHHSSKASVLRW